MIEGVAERAAKRQENSISKRDPWKKGIEEILKLEWVYKEALNAVKPEADKIIKEKELTAL